jgi:hypothetical protein
MQSSTTLRAARAAFFQTHGFGADGGYHDEVSDAQLGPFHYRVPNTEARRATLPAHDLHHVLTGYDVSWGGEAQISAFELASGVGRPSYTWIIALWGLFTGLLVMPMATLRAFVRGRGAANLVGVAVDDALLGRTVLDLRSEMGVRPDEAWAERPAHALALDLVAFAGWSLVALGFGLVALGPAAGMVAWSSLPACPLGDSALTA